MKLGLVCISEILKSRDKKLAFQTMTRKQFNNLGRDKALPVLSQRILHNCRLTRLIVGHCKQRGIAHYRLSSNLFPLVTDETLNIEYCDLPDFTEIKLALESILSEGISFSAHPDQFNVLPSHNTDTVRKTVQELNHQGRVMDWIGLPQDYRAPMCLHLGLSPKNEPIEDFVSRFYKAFDLCEESVRSRLVLENEDKGYWNCANLYDAFSGSFPLVYDNLHDLINPSPRSYFNDLVSTWGVHTPVFHWSEGLAGNSLRQHTDYFTYIPDVVSNNPKIIWECEVKAKDLAINKVLY